MNLLALLPLLGRLALAFPHPVIRADAEPTVDPTAGRAPHQPYQHGYNASGIKNWSASSDANARYLRSRVPLTTRIGALPATQANPALATGPQVMDLSFDYDNSFFTSYKYNDDFSRRAPRFWQYTDLYGSWHGMPVDGSPTDKPDHGLVNLPNPGWTDAAHRNGVRSLGCWFWPRAGEFSDYVEQKPDGSFPVADKLIEMAAYYGFDGYFINQEASIDAEDAKKLMAMVEYWRAKAPKGFHLQWYDTILVDGRLSYQNRFNDKNAPWVLNNGKPGVNSIFVNYAMFDDAQVESSVTAAKGMGLDPFEVVFQGTENEKYGYNPPYDTRLVFPEGKAARTSWGLFGSHFSWMLQPKHETADVAVQDAVSERENHYWSGPNGDPTHTGRTTYTAWADDDDGVGRDEADPTKWDGVAHYITEKSVIGALPFVTRFNTGKGTSFFLNGKSGAGGWNNLAIQDILPTWQFWTRSEGSGAPLDVAYDYSTAFNGGSSLRFKGALGPDSTTTVRLFKTDLKVAADDRLALTIKPATDGATFEVGLVGADNQTTWVPLDESSTKSDAGEGWTTYARPFGTVKNPVAALALRISSKSTLNDFSVNVGELSLGPACPEPPKQPQGFKVDAFYPSGDKAEVFLSWQISDAVWYYDITRDRADGSREVVGRIFDEVYYVKSLARDGSEAKTTLKLEAVAKDGSWSEAATATVSW